MGILAQGAEREVIDFQDISVWKSSTYTKIFFLYQSRLRQSASATVTLRDPSFAVIIQHFESWSLHLVLCCNCSLEAQADRDQVVKTPTSLWNRSLLRFNAVVLKTNQTMCQFWFPELLICPFHSEPFYKPVSYGCIKSIESETTIWVMFNLHLLYGTMFLMSNA